MKIIRLYIGFLNHLIEIFTMPFLLAMVSFIFWMSLVALRIVFGFDLSVELFHDLSVAFSIFVILPIILIGLGKES